MSFLDDLVGFAEQQLSERELEALWMRGVSDEQITNFRIGYLDKSLPDLDKAQDFLRWSANGSKLDDVLVLPLTNTLGQVKGVQFRHVEKGRSGYMDYFADKDEAVLFGLAQAIPHIWESESVYLVEGAFDLFPTQRVYPNVVATLTAHVSKTFIRLLRRLVKEVNLVYDMDEKGQEASSDFAKYYGRKFSVNVITLPGLDMPGGKKTKDPGELWEVLGDENFGVYLRRQWSH